MAPPETFALTALECGVLMLFPTALSIWDKQEARCKRVPKRLTQNVFVPVLSSVYCHWESIISLPEVRLLSSTRQEGGFA